MLFTVHTAKSQLSKLIDAAMSGDDIVIAKGSKPVVRIVPIQQGAFKIGLCAGRLGKVPNFLDPMDERELQDWET